MLNAAQQFVDKVNQGTGLDSSEALQILTAKGAALTAFMAGAQQLKETYCSDRAELCSIINAKSGLCPENCSFCAQSAYHRTSAQVYPLKTAEQMVEAAGEAEQMGSGCFGIVTSGTRVEPGEEFDELLKAIRRIRAELKVSPSVSIGLLDESAAKALVEAGCVTCHHNLETARSFFPQICTTHDYEDDVATIRIAKAAGMKVCSGGIFGLGEALEQRIEMGLTLRELGVDAVPLNFLSPIAGTPLEGNSELTPLDCLRIICLYRYLLPNKKITVCGGREHNLREFQSAVFMAGASGMMIGNYLTKAGRSLALDQQLLKDAEICM